MMRETTRLLCRAARARIGDVEPRSLEVREDVALRSEAGTIVKGPGGDTDDVPVRRRHRSTAHRAERTSISRRFLAHWCLIGLHRRSPAYLFEFSSLEYQLGLECGSARFPAARTMIEIKGHRVAPHRVLDCTAQAAFPQGRPHSKGVLVDLLHPLLLSLGSILGIKHARTRSARVPVSLKWSTGGRRTAARSQFVSAHPRAKAQRTVQTWLCSLKGTPQV